MNMVHGGCKIKAKHIQSGHFINYMLVTERLKEDYYRLLNLDSLNIMSGFKSTEKKEVLEYIEKVLKCEVVEITSN